MSWFVRSNFGTNNNNSNNNYNNNNENNNIAQAFIKMIKCALHWE